MRRTSGEGTIVQRPNGTYAAALRCNGVRRWVYGRTEKEVRRKLAELRQQVARQGQLADPGKRTVSDLLSAWLEAAGATLKPRTIETYRQLCNSYIQPVIGGLRLSRLTPDVIQRLLVPLQKQGRTRTAVKTYRALHRACKLAILWGWLPSNPCDRIIRPTYRPERKEVWTEDELRRFLEGAREHWLYPLYLLLLAGGLRLGEALALEWADLDFAAGLLTVRRGVQRIGKEWVFSTPKTRSSIRAIALPGEVLQVLKRHKAYQAEARLRLGGEWRRPGLMFTSERGDVLHASVVEHNLRRLCRHLGLPPMTPHQLRHLHASLLLAEGLPVPDVSKRLGHAHPGVTLSTYAHIVKQENDAAVAAIGKVLRNGATR